MTGVPQPRRPRRPGLGTRGAVAVAVTLLLVVLGATPAAAGTYYLRPGDPVFYGDVGYDSRYHACTAGYAIAGTSGTFIVSDAACNNRWSPVEGTGRQFGLVDGMPRAGSLLHTTRMWANHPIPPDDAVQILVDPLTGRTPGNGRIQSYVPTSEQVVGMLVGKMGSETGWTEGRVTGSIDWAGTTAICTTARTTRGDSGGPVWRWDQYGLRAVGIVVAYDPATGDGCYLPIEDLLRAWGAWLPVFPGSFPSGRAHPGMPSLSPDLPRLATGSVRDAVLWMDYFTLVARYR